MACQNGGTFERFWVKKKKYWKKKSYFDCVIDKYFQVKKKRQKFRLWALELKRLWAFSWCIFKQTWNATTWLKVAGIHNESCSVLGISTVHEQQRFQSTYTYVILCLYLFPWKLPNCRNIFYSYHVIPRNKTISNILSTSFFQF